MKHLVGLPSLRKEVEDICTRAREHCKLGLRPQNLIVPLDPGNGRTSVLEYVSGMYRKYGVLDFSSGPDPFVEIELDGSLKQMKQAFCTVEDAAIYANHYSHVVGMDVSEMAAHIHESQFQEFLRRTKELCGEACVIFFVHEARGRNEERLIERLRETVDFVKKLPEEPYSSEELCEAVRLALEEEGARVGEDPTLCSRLLRRIREANLHSVREARLAVQKILRGEENGVEQE